MPCLKTIKFTRETKKLRSSSLSYYLKDGWKSLRLLLVNSWQRNAYLTYNNENLNACQSPRISSSFLVFGVSGVSKWGFRLCMVGWLPLSEPNDFTNLALQINHPRPFSSKPKTQKKKKLHLDQLSINWDVIFDWLSTMSQSTENKES